MKHFLSLKRPSAIFALMVGISLISMTFVANPTEVAAQTSLGQCNGTDNVGGQAVECTYTVTNNLNGSVTSSSVTLTECHGAANDPPTMVCTSSTTNSTDLVTVIDQCNGSGNGGGGTVTCAVDVINNITGNAVPTSATVNQCNTAGTGGGTAPTTLCNPFPANTTGATVTQCNESGNGGGGTLRVRCTVDSDSTTTSILNVTVNQCNGSGNGGGAVVTCRTGLTNNVTAPSPGPSPTITPTDNPGDDNPGSDGPGDDNPSDDGPGDADNPGGDSPADRDTTSQVTHIPEGGADTGGGSMRGGGNITLLLLGFILLALAGPVLAVRVRDGSKV